MVTQMIVPVDFSVRIRLSQTISKVISRRTSPMTKTATTPMPAASVMPVMPM